MDNRRIETTEAREKITELKKIREEIENLVRDLETQFLSEFSGAYDSQRAQELREDISAMKAEIENINKETEAITQISENYVISSENVDQTN